MSKVKEEKEIPEKKEVRTTVSGELGEKLDSIASREDLPLREITKRVIKLGVRALELKEMGIDVFEGQPL